MDKLFKMEGGRIIFAPCACCGKRVNDSDRALKRCRFCGGSFDAMFKLFAAGIDPSTAHRALIGRRGYKKMDNATAEQLIWIKITGGEGH